MLSCCAFGCAKKKSKHDLKRSQEESVGENRNLQSKITQLEQQIKILECKLDVANMSLNDTVYEAEDAKSYELKNKQLEMTLSEVQHELESSKLEETRLKTFILELEEDIRERDKDLKIYYAEIQKFKDINSELQCELDTFKLEQVDVNRRGNSMFGELDDRRRYVEKEYKLLANKHTTLLENYEGNREELARCKVQMATLLSMSSRRYQEAYIKKLEDSLEDAKREVREVTVKLDRVLKVQKQASTNISSTGGDQYDYLRVLHAQAERKIKTLESEMMSLRVKNLADNDKLVESQRLVYCLQEEIDALKMTNLKLTNEIKDLTTVPDAAAPPTPEPNVEILPNYKPEDPNDATKENNESENTDILNDSDIVPGQILLDDDGYREIRPPRLSSGVVLREMNAALSRGEPEHFNKRLSFLKSKLSKGGVEKQRGLRDYGAKSESFVTNERKEGNCAQQ